MCYNIIYVRSSNERMTPLVQFRYNDDSTLCMQGVWGSILTVMLMVVEIFSFVIVCKRKEGVVLYQRASVSYVMLAVALP
jgi:hypothetical protein